MMMNRLSFLKTLLVSITTIPLFGVSNKKDNVVTYKFSDMFVKWELNNRLYYPKVDSPFYKHIESLAKESINQKNPKSWSYLSIYNIRIPIKEEYTHDELMTLFLFFESSYGKYYKFGVSNNSIFRMIKQDENSNTLHLEIYSS